MITGKEPIVTIAGAEPIGPQAYLDILIETLSEYVERVIHKQEGQAILQTLAIRYEEIRYGEKNPTQQDVIELEKYVRVIENHYIDSANIKFPRKFRVAMQIPLKRKA